MKTLEGFGFEEADFDESATAAQGNIVSTATTPVDFDDLTALLAAWAGPIPDPEPAPVKITMLIGSDDGHVVYLNGKQAGMLRGPRKLNPLAREYDLALKKGKNDLYIKVVNHAGPSQLTFAYRSPAIDVPNKLVKLLSVEASERSADEQTAVREYYRKVCCLHPDWLALIDQRKGVQKAKEKLTAEIPTTLVWKELAKPRQAHLLTRGQYDQPADAVQRARDRVEVHVADMVEPDRADRHGETAAAIDAEQRARAPRTGLVRVAVEYR